jgi:hypothetical protein
VAAIGIDFRDNVQRFPIIEMEEQRLDRVIPLEDLELRCQR